MIMLETYPIVTRSCVRPDDSDRYWIWKIQYDRINQNVNTLKLADNAASYLQGEFNGPR